jgi:hypothetical protein
LTFSNSLAGIRSLLDAGRTLQFGLVDTVKYALSWYLTHAPAIAPRRFTVRVPGRKRAFLSRHRDRGIETQAHLPPPYDPREPIEPEWHRAVEALAKICLAGAFIALAIVYTPFSIVLIKDLLGMGDGGIFDQPNEMVARKAICMTLLMLGAAGVGVAAVGAVVKMVRNGLVDWRK